MRKPESASDSTVTHVDADQMFVCRLMHTCFCLHSNEGRDSCALAKLQQLSLGNSTRVPGSRACPSIISLLTDLVEHSAIAGDPDSAALGELSCHSLKGFAPRHNMAQCLHKRVTALM